MRVTIVGGGNLGIACAARMAAVGLDVTLYTSNPEKWSPDVAVEDCNGQTFFGHLARITEDPRVAADCEFVYLCLPGHVIKDKLVALKPYLLPRTPITSVFSADGFFFMAEEVLGAQWPVLGFQRVPFIARTKCPYKLGGITGYRKALFLAHRNVDDPERWRRLFEMSFGTLTRLLDNFYEAALANSNPVIHPARLMSLRRKIEQDGPFKRMPLFYEEWDDVASEYAISLDSELRALAASKGAFLIPFLEYYESHDAHSLTLKIRSIPAFKGLHSPVLANGELDFSSRYIQADVYISLKSIVMLSRGEGLATPCSEAILKAFAL